MAPDHHEKPFSFMVYRDQKCQALCLFVKSTLNHAAVRNHDLRYNVEKKTHSSRTTMT